MKEKKLNEFIVKWADKFAPTEPPSNMMDKAWKLTAEYIVEMLEEYEKLKSE